MVAFNTAVASRPAVTNMPVHFGSSASVSTGDYDEPMPDRSAIRAAGRVNGETKLKRTTTATNEKTFPNHQITLAATV